MKRSTERAYKCVADRLHAPAILGVGCGPGAQTLGLAELSRGKITAIDNHEPHLEELGRRAATAGYGGSISPTLADMTEMSFERETFDLIWAEGSISIIGVEKGLAPPQLHVLRLRVPYRREGETSRMVDRGAAA